MSLGCWSLPRALFVRCPPPEATPRPPASLTEDHLTSVGGCVWEEDDEDGVAVVEEPDEGTEETR